MRRRAEENSNRKLKKILKNKYFQFSLLGSGLAAFFIPRKSAAAGPIKAALESVLPDVWTTLSMALIFLCKVIGSIMGMLLTFMGNVLNFILQQSSGMLELRGVIEGWQFMRDVTNMFFIIILLVVAFATIMRIESYQYKQILPKLILAIILVNFSRTICMVFIEFADVLMRGFLNISGGGRISHGFATELKLSELFIINESVPIGGEIRLESSIVWSYIFATSFLVLFTIAIVLLCLLLIVRGIALIILLILSPIIFVLNVLPATASYASAWWNAFAKYLLYGPVAALFIALSLKIIRSLPGTDVMNASMETIDGSLGASESYTGTLSAIKSDGLNTYDEFLTFILAIAFLYATFFVAQHLGLVGGQAIVSGVQRGAAGTGMAAGRFMKNRMGQFGEGWFSRNVPKVAKRIPIVGSVWSGASRGIQRIRKRGDARNILAPSRWVSEMTKMPGRFAGGVRMLPYIGQGWKNRKTRREGELDAIRGAQAEDAWNYVRAGTYEKSQYGVRAMEAQRAEKEREMSNKESGAQRNALFNAKTMAERAAGYTQLAKSLNLNDYMNEQGVIDRNKATMDKVIAKISKEQGIRDAGGDYYSDVNKWRDDGYGVYCPEMLKAVMKSEMGDSEMSARVASDIGELLGENGQMGFFGLGAYDGKSNKMKFTDDELQKDIITDKVRKITPRRLAALEHSNNTYMEGIDGTLRGTSPLQKHAADRNPAGMTDRWLTEMRDDNADGAASFSGTTKHGVKLTNAENYIRMRLNDLDPGNGKGEYSKLEKKYNRAKGSSKKEFYRKEINNLEKRVQNSIAVKMASLAKRTGTMSVVNHDGTVNKIAIPDDLKSGKAGAAKWEAEALKAMKPSVTKWSPPQIP